MTGVSDLLVNLCVAIMLLFFMLYEGKSMEHYISTLLPFKAENKIEVLKKVQLMVRSMPLEFLCWPLSKDLYR